MKSVQIAKELEEAARQLDVRVRKEKGNFRGGYCIRKGEEILMLNRQHPPEIQVAVLAGALKNLPIESVYLKPAVRQALEEAWKTDTLVEFESEDDE